MEQSALLIDTVVRDIVTAGTSVQYAGGKASTVTVAKTDIINSGEIRKAVRTLRKNNAKGIKGQEFIGIMSPETEYDIMSDSAWVDVSKYSASTQIFDGEVGKLFGVRFIRTSNAKVKTGAGASSCDIHCTLIVGDGAYGVVDINGGSSPEFIVKDFGSAGTSDPLSQIATSGWKAIFTAIRLQELAMVRIEHGVS